MKRRSGPTKAAPPPANDTAPTVARRADCNLRLDPFEELPPAPLNALIAVELDPVRRRERLLDLRLYGAVMLSLRVEVCEALLAGVPVPVSRLAPEWIDRLGLAGDVVLGSELAVRINALGPLRVERRAL